MDSSELSNSISSAKKRKMNPLFDSEDEANSLPKQNKIKVRKFALFLGYLGTNYHGSQMQRSDGKHLVSTVESKLEEVLRNNSCIPRSRKKNTVDAEWSRVGRTDKGVHAVCQVISGSFWEDFPTKLQQINKTLPDDIRLFAAIRTTGGFDARLNCSKRRYEYLMPAFCLRPDQDISKLKEPATPEEIKLLTDSISHYEGTKNFHNFTSRKECGDPSCKRFIEEILVSPLEDHPYAIRIRLTGQSFLLNQIRKMIGLAIEVCRGSARPTAIEAALKPKVKFSVPIAPAEGLCLERVSYAGYNQRRLDDNSPTDPLDIDNDEDVVAKAVIAFKQTVVDPVILSSFFKEKEANPWLEWLGHIQRFPYEKENEESYKLVPEKSQTDVSSPQ